MDVARGFFEHHRMPEGFHRRNGSFGLQEISNDVNAIYRKHIVLPGMNKGAVDTYEPLDDLDNLVSTIRLCRLHLLLTQNRAAVSTQCS